MSAGSRQLHPAEFNILRPPKQRMPRTIVQRKQAGERRYDLLEIRATIPLSPVLLRSLDTNLAVDVLEVYNFAVEPYSNAQDMESFPRSRENNNDILKIIAGRKNYAAEIAFNLLRPSISAAISSEAKEEQDFSCCAYDSPDFFSISTANISPDIALHSAH